MSFTLRLSILCFLLLATGYNSHAAQKQGHASVVIAKAITLTEKKIVDFKTIPADNGLCEMGKKGQLSGQCAGFGPGEPGKFRIKGSPNYWVDVTVSTMDPVGGVTFIPKLAKSNSQSLSIKLNNNGVKNVKVIGALDLNNATAGAKTLNYTISVNYQ